MGVTPKTAFDTTEIIFGAALAECGLSYRGPLLVSVDFGGGLHRKSLWIKRLRWKMEKWQRTAKSWASMPRRLVGKAGKAHK